MIGPNGAGKTTLINQLIGELLPDAGTIISMAATSRSCRSSAARCSGLSRSYQITSVFPDFTALENVAIAAQAHAGHSFGFWTPGDAARKR